MKKLKYLSFINMAGVLRKSIKSVKRLSGVISTNIINVTNIINGDGSYCDIGDFELPDKTVDEILKLKDDGFIPSADDLENTMIQIIRATCREIRTNVIPAILAQYYTPENLPTLIRYLNEMLKDKYQFNHNIRKIIFGLSQGKNEQDSYDERTYKKAKQKFEKLKSQPPKEFNKFIKEALPELLRKDLIFISRLLLAINCLEMVYNQIFVRYDDTTKSENKSNKARREKPDAEFEKRREKLASGFKIYLDIEPQYVPSYYTFDIDLSKEAQKSKTKAWKSFRDNLDNYLESKDFGQLKAHGGKTIATNYIYIYDDIKIPMKALYYLVFKINELYNNLSEDGKKDFKNSLKEDVRAQPEESDNACSNMTSSLKNKFVEELNKLRTARDSGDLTDDARFKFLKLIEMNATNPNKIELLTRATNMNPLFRNFDKNFQNYYDEKCQTISEEEPLKSTPKKINRQELINQEAQKLAVQLAEELAKKLKPPTDTGTALTEEAIQQQLEKKKKTEEEASKEKNKEGKEYINYATIKDEKLFFKDAKKSKFGKKRSYGLRASTRCFAGEANKKKLRSYKKKSNKRKRSGEATRSKRADLRLRRISIRKKIGAK